MKRITALALALFMIFCFAACGAPKSDRVIEGSITFTKGNFPKIVTVNNHYNAVVSLVSAVLDCPLDEAKTLVLSADSEDDAYARFADGEGDMIIAAEPSDAALAYFSEKSVAVKEKNIAFEALAVVTGVDNFVGALTAEQIGNIYSGTSLLWNELGGTEKSITAYPAKGELANRLFDKYISVNTDALTVYKREVVLENGTYTAEQSFVATDSSIGLMLYSDFTSKSVNKSGRVKAFSVNGVDISDSTIKDATYPFVLKINASVRDNKTVDYADILLNWLVTPMGIEIIQKAGFLA